MSAGRTFAGPALRGLLQNSWARLVLASLLGCTAATWAPPTVAAAPDEIASSKRTFVYTGPGSCSAIACHGGIKAKPPQISRVLQNEYSTWVVQDKHSQSYSVLDSALSHQIGRNLHIQQPKTDHKCLSCHSLEVPLEQRARSFDATDGVSCESCHGPAEAWLGLHTTVEWRKLTPRQKAEQGMCDTKKLNSRSELCLSCHMGTPEKFVDHEMIAAGHPDVYFELESFSAQMPRHWKEPLDVDPWIGARSWGVGQAVQLREDLNRLARRKKDQAWPEFSELDCFACHHSLTDASHSWRQKRGYPARHPGEPPWNTSRYAVFRQLAAEVDAGASRQLKDSMSRLFTQMSHSPNDSVEIDSEARSSAVLADQLVQRIAQTRFDAALVLRMLRNISGDSEYIARQGERAAEQAAMALNSLFIAYRQNERVSNAEQIQKAINNLFSQVDARPSEYDPGRFAEKLRTLNALLR